MARGPPRRLHCTGKASTGRSTAGVDRRPSPAGAGQEGRRPSLHHDRPWTLHRAPARPVGRAVPARERAGNAETVVVVPVPGGVPVAVRRAQVPRFVVPGTAPQNPSAGGRSGSRHGSKRPPRKMAWRKRQVFACSAWAIHDPTRCSTSSWVTVPCRHRSRRPRNRLRKRRTLSSGSLRYPPVMRTKPRKCAGTEVSSMPVFLG